MIDVGISCCMITSETFSTCIIIMIYFFPGPDVLALDAKMIVGFQYQYTLSCKSFVNTLCKLDGCRNSCTLHFAYGQILVGDNILVNASVRCCEKENGSNEFGK